MSNFDHIKFDPNNGIYFDATIGEATKKVFLDLTLLEDLSGKKSISNSGVALTMFYSLRTTIYRMCLNAFNENPDWPINSPLALLKKHNR
jgi:hypothetical protein